MVGAVEQKLRPAGDGAELADDQPLVVDGIVVEHVVFLKVPGVVDEVVVHGVIPHDDGGIGHHVLQIDRAVPLGAGIDLPLRDHLKNLLSVLCLADDPAQHNAALHAYHLTQIKIVA